MTETPKRRRIISPRNPGDPITCETCGITFTPLSYNARFCSITCKRSGEYHRAKARGDARRSAGEAERLINEGARIASNPDALPTGTGTATQAAITTFLTGPDPTKCKHVWVRDPSDGTRLCRLCETREG